MPKISISHDSKLKTQDSYVKIKEFFETDQDIRKFDPKIKYEFNDSQNSGKAIGSQFKADFAVLAVGDGSKVTVDIDLPFLLTPLKGKISEMITKKLSRYLA